MKRVAFLLLFSALVTVAAFADDDQDQHHHEDLASAQLGTVAFPVSCAPSVQKPFERGVALLHSFWYEEAEKEFIQVSADDPHCAMAHWGAAMSLWHQLWNEPNKNVIQRGADQVHEAKTTDGPTTPREHAYIAAIAAFYGDSRKLNHEARAKAYSDAMKKVYETYPDDHEAAVFYALSLLASEPHDDATFANRKQAAAILEKLFAIEPNHPGVAHYLIHSYDKPQLAQLGLPAARRYAQVAPASPHALHMPSHIFARVGLWQDDIDSNLASIAATRKTAAMHMGGEGHQFHAMDFLFYAYMQSGHESEAQKMIEEVKTMPPTSNMYGMDFDPRVSSQAWFEASYALELHDWHGAASLSPVPGADPEINATTFLARAIGAARSGQLADARKDVDEVKSIAARLMKKKKKDEADFLTRQIAEPLAWIAHAEGRDDDAIKLLRPLAEKETDGMSDVGDYLPAQEMIADLLLEVKRPEQALAEYQTDLKLNPNRFDGLYGAARAAEAAGKQNDAAEYYALLLKVCDGSNSTRPELSHARELVAQK
jgi:tetratricopeptide (TPR) repeat protein